MWSHLKVPWSCYYIMIIFILLVIVPFLYSNTLNNCRLRCVVTRMLLETVSSRQHTLLYILPRLPLFELDHEAALDPFYILFVTGLLIVQSVQGNLNGPAGQSLWISLPLAEELMVKLNAQDVSSALLRKNMIFSLPLSITHGMEPYCGYGKCTNVSGINLST